MNKLLEKKKSGKHGVYYFSDILDETPIDDYVAIRKKENRFYNLSTLKVLPDIEKDHQHYNEWMIRKQSMLNLKTYLSKNSHLKNIMDLGCGNGWMTNCLSNNTNFVCGVDVNLPELEQAAQAFDKENLDFLFADIFYSSLPTDYFDIIILSSSVQYFKNFNELIDQLSQFLKENGEIHIIDSPFYERSEITSAMERTTEYYTGMGFPKMAENYFHHSLDDLTNYNYEILFDPKTLANKFKKKFTQKFLSPFKWIKITK